MPKILKHEEEGLLLEHLTVGPLGTGWSDRLWQGSLGRCAHTVAEPHGGTVRTIDGTARNGLMTCEIVG